MFTIKLCGIPRTGKSSPLRKFTDVQRSSYLSSVKVGTGEQRFGHESSYGVPDEDDRLGRPLLPPVLAQDVVDARGSVVGLPGEGASVERRELLVEVDGEIVEVHLVLALFNRLPESDRGKGADLRGGCIAWVGRRLYYLSGVSNFPLSETRSC